MNWARFFLFLTLLSGKTYAADSFAMILSGGDRTEDNFYRYYETTKEMFKAFRSAGIPRDNIVSLYADGVQGLNTTKPVLNPFVGWFSKAELVAPPVSLEGDGATDIKYPATASGISKAFDELAKKVKDGDKLTLFVTDHGSLNDGIILWGGQGYSVRDLKAQLQKLPSGVTVQIATNMCYGGQLIDLTGHNVCVVANTDAKTIAFSKTNNNAFASAFAKAIQKPKSERKTSLIEAFEVGRLADESQNNKHRTSLDAFIEKQSSAVPPGMKNSEDCDLRQSPMEAFRKEISEISSFLNQTSDSRKEYYEKYLKKKLQDFSETLNSDEIKKDELARSKSLQDLDQLKQKWSSLSEVEQTQQRPQYTALAEKLKSANALLWNKTQFITADQRRTLNEVRFLKRATSAQLEQYMNIRKCLEREI